MQKGLDRQTGKTRTDLPDGRGSQRWRGTAEKLGQPPQILGGGNAKPYREQARYQCKPNHSAASAQIRSSANLLLVSAVGYGGLALRTLTMTYWKHLPGSLFSVLEDLNLLQGDEAAGHHLVKDGQETVDAVFAIDDFD